MKVLNYIGHRILQIIPLLIAISIIIFVIIQLPPGNYLTTYIQQLKLAGTDVGKGQIESLTHQYGLDQPLYVQYFIWMKNILFHWNFGESFQWNEPQTPLGR